MADAPFSRGAVQRLLLLLEPVGSDWRFRIKQLDATRRSNCVSHGRHAADVVFLLKWSVSSPRQLGRVYHQSRQVVFRCQLPPLKNSTGASRQVTKTVEREQ